MDNLIKLGLVIGIASLPFVISFCCEVGFNNLWCWYFHKKYHEGTWSVMYAGHGTCRKCKKEWYNNPIN